MKNINKYIWTLMPYIILISIIIVKLILNKLGYDLMSYIYYIFISIMFVITLIISIKKNIKDKLNLTSTLIYNIVIWIIIFSASYIYIGRDKIKNENVVVHYNDFISYKADYYKRKNFIIRENKKIECKVEYCD